MPVSGFSFRSSMWPIAVALVIVAQACAPKNNNQQNANSPAPATKEAEIKLVAPKIQTWDAKIGLANISLEFPGNDNNIKNIFESALAFVQICPPKNNPSVFNWPEKIKRNVDKLSILGTSAGMLKSKAAAGDPLYQAIFEQTNGMSGMDALTVRADDEVITILLLDRILWDAKGNEAPEGFAKLSLIGAHEIYGNAPRSLMIDPKVTPSMDPRQRLESEISAYRAGIEFAETAMANTKISQKIRDDLEKLVGKEKPVLERLKELKKKSGSLSDDEIKEGIQKSLTTPVSMQKFPNSAGWVAARGGQKSLAFGPGFPL